MLSVVFLLLLIARSKLIPDFALTLHFLHLVVTSLYSRSLPSHWFWWALQVASAGLMTALGVWSCQYRELRPISFGGKARATPGGNTAEDATESQNNEETGYSAGRGRGRGRDGAGEYEMVGMSDTTERV